MVKLPKIDPGETMKYVLTIEIMILILNPSVKKEVQDYVMNPCCVYYDDVMMLGSFWFEIV